ncbi:MAG: hypothetical protein L0H64_13610 [Pseudonocardia sp.]|nr:hypothetical protein [Pseudonocardia sp.]
MRNEIWVADVGVDHAKWLATESRTAGLAREYRPVDDGDGRIRYNWLALGAARELGEEEDGYLTDDGDGLRVWIGDEVFELELADG